MISAFEAAETCRDGLHAEFLRSCASHANRPCLEAPDRRLSYAEAYAKAAAIAATLGPAPVNDGQSVAGVFAGRTSTAFTAALGVLLSGRGVVPLNPAFPAHRTRRMLELSCATELVADKIAVPQLLDVLAPISTTMTVLLPDQEVDRAVGEALPQHRFLGGRQLSREADWRPRSVDPGSVAYLLFTSGSTGTPKGVGLLHRNLTHYVREGLRRYRFDHHDRFAQLFDFTWDTHLFNLWGCWAFGACAVVPRAKEVLNPSSFLSEKAVTVVDLVPSTGYTMLRMGGLKPGRYPHLRYVRFGGEAVPAEQVQKWTDAAPNALVDSTYGPTESTVEVTYYDWNPQTSPGEAERGIVPIGFPCPGTKLLVVDEELLEVPVGEVGELLITGPQVAPGYWKDPDRTAQAFVVPPGHSEVSYRTGDLVRRPKAGKPMCFIGRRDSQIKIFGARVELDEVEAALREVSGTPFAVAFGWPKVSTGVGGIVAFLAQPQLDVKGVLARLKDRLPGLMVPREIRLLDALPLTGNGKIDRLALLSILEGN